MDELKGFIGVNFVMTYHKLPNLRSYWETGYLSLSLEFVVNVMTRERFKDILCNLQFPKDDVVTRDHPATVGHLK